MREFISGQADVGGLAAQVEAVLDHTLILLAEKGVCSWAAVSGNDMEGLLNSHFQVDCMEQIKEAQIHGYHFVRTVITQDMVDFSEGRLKVIP